MLILGDEPKSNLDTRIGEEIMVLFQDLHAEGRTIVIATHESDIACHCQRIAKFCNGKVVGDGRVEAPINTRAVLASLGN